MMAKPTSTEQIPSQQRS